MWGHLITVKSLSTCWMLCGVSSARTTFFLDRHLAVFSCERHKCNWFYLHRGGGVMCAFLFFSFWDAKITSKPNPHAVCWWDVRCEMYNNTLCTPPLLPLWFHKDIEIFMRDLPTNPTGEKVQRTQNKRSGWQFNIKQPSFCRRSGILIFSLFIGNQKRLGLIMSGTFIYVCFFFQDVCLLGCVCVCTVVPCSADDFRLNWIVVST